MGLRKYNKKRRPLTPEEFEDYSGRRLTFWLFVIAIIIYYVYSKYKQKGVVKMATLVTFRGRKVVRYADIEALKKEFVCRLRKLFAEEGKLAVYTNVENI